MSRLQLGSASFADGGPRLGRRTLLAASLAAGGSLLVGFPLLPSAHAATAAAASPDAYIRIEPSGRVTLLLPYVEMGQGAYTSQAQILAEELEVDLASVVLEAAPPDPRLYANPLFGEQLTGGSASLRGAWMSLRTAGAAARVMLIEAAAQRWRVAAASCHAEQGQVLHRATGRRSSYGELAAAAARLPVPEDPPLKAPSTYRVIGKPVKRLEAASKIDGSVRFGIDAQPVGLRYATVAASPVFGGKLGSIDACDALQVPGVQQVVQLDDAVAVVATNTWAARKGLAALVIRWDEGALRDLGTGDLVQAADDALERAGRVALTTGNVAAAEAAAASRHELTFRMPMLAHAAMEPLSCTVHLSGDRCEVWLGTQFLARARMAAAEAAGIPIEKVVLNNHLLGGGFGRRLESDYVGQAVRIAKQVKGPVKITWSREEDMQHDYYRYINHSRITVGCDAGGRPISWRHRLVGPNIMARFLPIYQKDGIDLDVIDDASGPYDIPNVLVDFVRNEAPEGLATGNWRGVGPTRNVWVVESILDELATRAGRDPIAYRLGLMSGAPRARATLERIAAESGWGSPLPKRSGRGVSVFSAFGSHLATVAEVQVDGAGQVRVTRVVCAIDAGFVVNPEMVRAQIEGGVVFGISAVLWGRITVRRGRVEQGNFDSYRVLRMHESPPVEVHIVDSSEAPGGVGEPGTAGAIAAVVNAVFAATGRRITTLPLDPAELREA